MTIPAPLHPFDLFRAGHDTAHIAVMLGISEAEAYNRMAQEREVRLRAFEKKRRREWEREQREKEAHAKRDHVRRLSLRFIERRNAGQLREAHQ